MAYDSDAGDGGQGVPDQTDNTSDPYGAAKRKSVADMYQSALGRQPSENEINAQLQGGSGDMTTIQQGIYGSDEAKQYNQNQQNAYAQQQQTQQQQQAATQAALKPTGPGTGNDQYGNPLPAAQPQYQTMSAPAAATYTATPAVAPTKTASTPVDYSNGGGISTGRWLTPEQGGDATGQPAGGPTSRNQLPGSVPGGNPDINANISNFAQNLQPGQSGGIVQNPNATSQALVDQLTQRAQQSLNIDPTTDSIIHPQVDAAAATIQRGNRNMLNDMAESGNPYSTGAMQNAATQTQEAGNQQVAGLQSQLVQNELGARRGEIQNALGSMGSLLTNDQQLGLQRQMDAISSSLGQQQMNNNLGLGLLQNANQSTSIGNQNSQYYAGLSQQDQQFLNNLALQYQGMNNQNSQFASTFGLNSTNQANYWDALRRGLIHG